MPVDDAATVRLANHIWRDGGLLVNFVINIQRIRPGGWETVEYVDCCHGHCHLHTADDRTESIMTLDTVHDVQAAFRAATETAMMRAGNLRGEGK